MFKLLLATFQDMAAGRIPHTERPPSRGCPARWDREKRAIASWAGGRRKATPRDAQHQNL